jgi:hypothetical protein
MSKQRKPSLCSVEEASKRLGCKAGSLKDHRFRARLGLRAVKIGKSLQFLESDITALILRRREVLPDTASGGDQSL